MFGKAVDRVSGSIDLMVYGPRYHCPNADEGKGLSQGWMHCTAFHNWCSSFQIWSFWLCAGRLSLFPHALFSFAYLLHRILVPSKWKCPIKSGITQTALLLHNPTALQNSYYIILPELEKWHHLNRSYCLWCFYTTSPESHHLHWASCLGQNFQTRILRISCLSISMEKKSVIAFSCSLQLALDIWI